MKNEHVFENTSEVEPPSASPIAPATPVPAVPSVVQQNAESNGAKALKVTDTTETVIGSSRQKLSPGVNEQKSHPLREWFFKKVGSYVDGIIVNLLSAAVLGGGLWLAQKIWGLRLIPFNILDAVFIGSLTGVGVLLLLVFIFVLAFYRYFKKHPELLVGIALIIVLFAIMSWLLDKSFKSGRPFKWEFPPKESTTERNPPSTPS